MIELKNLDINEPSPELKKLVEKTSKLARGRTKEFNLVEVSNDNPEQVTSVLHLEQKPIFIKKNEREYEIQVTISSTEDPEERTLHNLARKIN